MLDIAITENESTAMHVTAAGFCAFGILAKLIGAGLSGRAFSRDATDA